VKTFRIRILLALVFLTAINLNGQNAVVRWNGIASTTIVSNGKQASVSSGVWFAYVHLAVYDAVNAIDPRFQPYVYEGDAQAGASQDAAVAAAAHRVLVHYFSAQQPSLDAQFNSFLGAIPDSPGNVAAGVAIGEEAAQALIAARASDGLLANVPYTPLYGTGFWQPTPPLFGPPLTPWLAKMQPFTMLSADQFLPEEGPPALNSQEWIDDYNQVKALGAANSAIRTPAQTEIGRFWTEHTGQQFARAFRNLATQKALSTSDTARLMAMLWTGFADAGIGCWNAKFSFNFWRPVTAIRAGGGNPDLVGDPNWSPLGSTPSHPEYPAAHGCGTGAVATILSRYFGTQHLSFSVDSLVTGKVHNFDSTNDLIEEVEQARIYAGFHYHHSVAQGRRLGVKVAHHMLSNFFKARGEADDESEHDDR